MTTKLPKLIKVKAIPGRPHFTSGFGEAEAYGVAQGSRTAPLETTIFGPVRPSELDAALSWNSLARKLNGEKV